jgi:hypothetical protein
MISNLYIEAPTTLLLLKGQSPAMFHPSLHTKRLKQAIIRDEKLSASPEGLGVGGTPLIFAFVRNLTFCRRLYSACPGSEAPAGVAIHPEHYHNS